MWDIACLSTGQNATEDKPTNETRLKLAELWRANFDGRLSIEWPTGFDHDAALEVSRGRHVVLEWAGHGKSAKRRPVEWTEFQFAMISRFEWRRHLTLQLKEELLAEGMAPENLDRYAKDLIIERPHSSFDRIKADAMTQEALRRSCLQQRKPFPLPGGATLLTEWANKQTWSPEEGAYLVCGLVPPRINFVDKHLGRADPAQVTGLCGNVFSMPLHVNPAVIVAEWMERWGRAIDRPERESPQSFIAWCKSRGIDTSWLDSMATTAQPAPALMVVGAVMDDSTTWDASEPAQQGTVSKTPDRCLETSAIAEAFSCIGGLKRKLSDVSNHKWLLPARITHGTAPKPSTWCPLKLAKILLIRGASEDALNRAFLQEAALKPWLTEWQEARRARNAFGQ